MARKSLKDLVSRALGVDEVAETDAEAEELLDIVTPEEHVASRPTKLTGEENVIKSAEPIEKLETAFNVTYDRTTRKYSLVTLQYKEDGSAKVISSEPFATMLAEVNYKVGQLLLEKLKSSLK